MNFKKLLLLFILVPILELGIFILLADVISIPYTLLIIVITGILGAYLTKRQGAMAMQNFKSALGSGKIPHVEATDGILILLAGAVLLTPGFLTDAVGFALLIPPVRYIIRTLVSDKLKKHIKIVPPSFGGAANSPEPAMKSAKGRVVEEA